MSNAQETTSQRRNARRSLATKAPESRRPATDFNLTDEERAILPDPDWVTEDDSDAIIAMRRETSEKPVPLESVLKRYGYRMEG